MNKQKLRPVVYTTNYIPHGASNNSQQLMLLKALQITNDPKELRKMMGVRTVTEVYRTLDKMSIRKDYHAALARAGLTLDFVVDGLKGIAVGAEKDSDRLSALKTILQSIGLDKYDSADVSSGGTWEEELLKALGKEKTEQLTSGSKIHDAEYVEEDYEVRQPVIPDGVKKKREEEEALVKGIYG